MTMKTSCLNIDHILDRILGKLPLRNKFTVQLVCQRWKHRSIVVLKQHKSVVLSCNRPGRGYIGECKEHPTHQENVITFDLYDMESWKQVLPFLPGIEFLYLDISPNVATEPSYYNYRDLLKYVVKRYNSQLQCLSIPGHGEYGGDLEDFLKTDCFPQMRHLHFGETSDTNLRRIIKSCPRLECLVYFTDFIKWNLLPKGFKKIDAYNAYLEGMVNLLTGQAAETIEEIVGMKLVSGVFPNHFSLPRLSTLKVCTEEDTNGCLNNLARIVRFSPVLKKLSIRIESTAGDIDASSWVKVIEECSQITDFTVQLTWDRPLTWQDTFAKSVSVNMKKLKTLKLDFALSPIGLRKLSSLPELQVFHHKSLHGQTK